MNTPDEQSKMLHRAGNFYSAQNDSFKKKAGMLTKVYTAHNAMRICQHAVDGLGDDSALSTVYDVAIPFDYDHVTAIGMDDVLQNRTSLNTPRNPLSADDSTAVTHDSIPVSVSGRYLVLPYNTVLEFSSEAGIMYTVPTGDNVVVESISKADGSILMRGVDFIAYFGVVILPFDPRTAFNDLVLRCNRATINTAPMLKYTLQQGCAGGDGAIFKYFRTSQTPESLFAACAQAAGFPVFETDRYVIGRVRQVAGYRYFTDRGDFVLPFQHIPLETGTRLPANTPVGTDQLLSVGKAQPVNMRSLPYVDVSEACAYKGLYILPGSTTITPASTKWRDVFSTDPDSMQKTKQFTDYLDRHDAGNQLLGDYANVADALIAAMGDGCILVRINEQCLPKSMLISIKNFVTDHRLVGSVLLYAPITTTIPA